MRASVEWNGENAAEIEGLLRLHVARADKEGDQCCIRGIDGMSIVLDLGDRVMIEGDRLGVLRKAVATAEPTIVWTGANLGDIANFLKAYRVRLDVIGQTLFIYGEGEPQPATLNRGDRLIERGHEITVRKVGRDHRA
jgi:hypothetical protein